MVLLAKTKLYTKEILISRSLVNSYIGQVEFVFVSNALK